MNTITVTGNVGGDPEIRYTPNGLAVVKFSVADTSGKDDKKRTQWHRVVAFGEQAENIVENVRKGSRVVVNGYLKMDKYTDREGNEKMSYEITADDVAISLRFKARAEGSGQQMVAANSGYPEGEEPF